MWPTDPTLKIPCPFLFSEVGEEYCPPSQYLLPVLESDCDKQNTDCLDGLEEAWQVHTNTHDPIQEERSSSLQRCKSLFDSKCAFFSQTVI